METDKSNDYIQTLINPNQYDHIFHVVTSPECAVKVLSNGKHCPEKGLFKIVDSDEYLCEKCYENYIKNKI